jgi:pilus assembly protein CpaB
LLFRSLRATAVQRKAIQIVAATRELPPGVPLTPKDLTMLDWFNDTTPSGSFSKLEDVVGRPLIHSMGASEPILKRDLGLEGSGMGLAGRIPAGMRATAVKSNEIVGVAGFLYPGSHVDVLATYAASATTGPLTQTVLQDVEVLAAGQTIEPDPQGKPEAVDVVTLLLSPEDSQKLLLTSGQGTIQFVLRSGVDQKNVEIRPTRLNQLIAAENPPASPAAPRKSIVPAAPPRQTVYLLEMIQGTERSVQKF